MIVLQLFSGTFVVIALAILVFGAFALALWLVTFVAGAFDRLIRFFHGGD